MPSHYALGKPLLLLSLCYRWAKWSAEPGSRQPPAPPATHSGWQSRNVGKLGSRAGPGAGWGAGGSGFGLGPATVPKPDSHFLEACISSKVSNPSPVLLVQNLFFFFFWPHRLSDELKGQPWTLSPQNYIHATFSMPRQGVLRPPEKPLLKRFQLWSCNVLSRRNESFLTLEYSSFSPRSKTNSKLNNME